VEGHPLDKEGAAKDAADGIDSPRAESVLSVTVDNVRVIIKRKQPNFNELTLTLALVDVDILVLQCIKQQ
jgi:hypothetical protein